MNFNDLDYDIIQYIISNVSILAVFKLYTVNKRLITEERLDELINNKWKINIRRRISSSILSTNYLHFDRDVPVPYKFKLPKVVKDYNIVASNHIIAFKYNNIANKDVALQDLLCLYDKIYTRLNLESARRNSDVKSFKKLVGGECFDLNMLEYINIYSIYEMFKSSMSMTMNIFIKKYKTNILERFTIVSLFNANKGGTIRNYMHLLMNIIANCQDIKHNRFKIYIAVQLCNAINLVVNKLDEEEHRDFKLELIKILEPVSDELEGLLYTNRISTYDYYHYMNSMEELAFTLQSLR
jgi:hypothetical protein